MADGRVSSRATLYTVVLLVLSVLFGLVAVFALRALAAFQPVFESLPGDGGDERVTLFVIVMSGMSLVCLFVAVWRKLGNNNRVAHS